MTDLSLIDDDETEIPGGEDGEGDEDQGNANGDEGQGEGDEEGDAGGEEDDGQEQEGLTDPPARRGRASESVREAKRTAKADRDRADRLEREIAEIRQAQNAPRQQSPQEIAAEAEREAAHVAMLDPAAQVQYYVAKAMQPINANLHQTRMQLQEQTDRAEFRALQTSNPLARKYATDVEKMVSDQKSRGFTVSREIALKQVLGERLFEQSMKNAGKAKKAGASRIAAATGRPGRATGEASSDRGGRRGGDDSIEALERRLKGVTF